MTIPKPLSTTKVAAFCHVSHAAVCNWVKSGKLKAYRTPGGQYRIEPHVLLDFMKQHGMPIPEELSARNVKRVVVVDDEVEILELVRRGLGKQGAGYEVETAPDGYTAGRLVHSLAPDLVLLDIRMPGIDGISVCRNIKTDPATAKTKVLVVSAYATDDNIRKLRDLGAGDFLEKPFDVTTLVNKVKNVIGEP
jgi:excisionase family DNA binding protein